MKKMKEKIFPSKRAEMCNLEIFKESIGISTNKDSYCFLWTSCLRFYFLVFAAFVIVDRKSVV